jgi:hypothetical protein
MSLMGDESRQVLMETLDVVTSCAVAWAETCADGTVRRGPLRSSALQSRTRTPRDRRTTTGARTCNFTRRRFEPASRRRNRRPRPRSWRNGRRPVPRVRSVSASGGCLRASPDKYDDLAVLHYEMRVTVNGPNFDDPPIAWAHTSPVAVELPSGRVKYVVGLVINLPDTPADQIATVRSYLQAFRS